MRFLPIACLSLLPITAAAQQLKIGLSARAMYHSGMSRENSRFAWQDGFGYSGCFSVAQVLDWVEVKYAFEIGELIGSQREAYLPAPVLSNGFPAYPPSKIMVYQTIAQPYYLPHAVVNARIRLNNGIAAHAGMLLGFSVARGRGKIEPTQFSGSMQSNFRSFTTYGFATGVQAGASLPLSKHFELSGELAWRRIWMSELLISIWGPAHSVRYQLNTWQLGAGINYIFGSNDNDD